MIGHNRKHNLGNLFQGDSKKVLCVCSAGMLRSPTIAWMLSNPPFDYNTRAVGITAEYALIPIDEGLVMWADAIVVVHNWMKEEIQRAYITDAEIFVVETPDDYELRDPKLIEYLEPRLKEIFDGS